VSSAVTVPEAYRECERITREQARNFSWGIRLLPEPKRHALSAVYAMARRIDDIGDGSLPAPEKLRLLAEARAGAIDPAAHRDDPVLLGLGEMDVSGRHYDSFDDLVEYCRCVAGSIGRLSLGVFNPALPPGELDRAAELADALGIALQLTNILRDVREDLQNGRIYLPERDLDVFGCELTILVDGTLDPCDGALAEVIRFEAARAWGWYDRGLTLIELLDRRSAACCAAMAGIYGDLLARIAGNPTLVMGGRLSLPTSRKLRIATQSIARPRGRRG
jgi:15-cis-phytoene synthase